MIIFQNDGEIDRRLVTSFGTSAKEPGSIGFFGTGLKYAIAILLRLGQKVTIYSGEDKMVFGVRKETIRGKDFDFVTLNRRRCDFTTEVGKTWEIWQAFRELYCNTMDEKGLCWLTPDGWMVIPSKGKTTIVVEGADFEEVYNNRGTIILSTEPIVKGLFANVHPGPSQYVYYKGIRAHTLTVPSLYTYDMQTSMQLTEDRTFQEPFFVGYYVQETIRSMQDVDAVRKVVTSPKDNFEASLHYDGTVGDTFRDVVVGLARAFDKSVNPSAVHLCRMTLSKSLSEAGEVVLEPLEVARLAKAKAFCARLGFPVEEYPIHVSEFLGESVLGRAHEDGIYISRRALMQGTKILAGTLLEEYLHLKHKLVDGSGVMQNFLIDLVVTMGERITGEPL